ncbi:acyl-CoA transferase [Amylibacter sp. SFDW26]|uniref:CoA transferase n=1 Tax=Amylibacter sp. SFDW26 TaxID=2652722 RepID=UPI001262A6F8|nr:CoA transferase [Amylibacter sp. SFDW26]KAB7614823.1 acyl-CoA transferase [Amylibacter sp. SFDW26]
MSLAFLDEIFAAFDVSDNHLSKITVSNTDENLPSWFETSDLAVATMAAAGVMASRVLSDDHSEVIINKRLASLWFDMTLRPIGWSLPPIWDAIAGDYQTADGWIRLHTNAPHHRKAALSVLGDYSDRESLRPVVAGWKKDDLELAIVSENGCAASMHDMVTWANHPQGQAVASEPLVEFIKRGEVAPTDRSLSGLKVLDLTRVLAGPIATRFLAGLGADVLRIDPLDWEEDSVAPEVTLGKRCAGLDLRERDDRKIFEELLKQADVLVHGYRADALKGLGYSPEALRIYNPKLVDVCLNAYGWTGPWAMRRGFDSLIQMSSGIADYGMKMSGANKPTPLPVQALDHGTGYLIASAVLRCLQERAQTGTVMSARLSLARVAHLLSSSKRTDIHNTTVSTNANDYADEIEKTVWGNGQRISFPLQINDVEFDWAYPAGPLRSSHAKWL